MESPAKLTRDSTMEATAKEGIEFLEKSNPELAEQCKAVAQESAENGSGDAPETAKNGSPAKLARDNTMVATAQEGKEFLERQGGVNQEAKTRAQESELNNSVSQEEDKSATKRPAEDEPEAEVDEKKQKTDETEQENEKDAEAKEQEEAAPEEQESKEEAAAE